MFDYARSEHRWREHTRGAGFVEGFQEIVRDASLTNDARSAAVEAFLLREAVAVGVVARVELSTPRNPNKIHKQMAPWFTQECREARWEFIRARRGGGRGSEGAREAFRGYRAECARAKAAFSRGMPDMLKYKPKQFWGMLARKG